jgi:hypothetical protein
VYYVVAGRLSEALDSTAWLVLLSLFTLEMGMGDRFKDTWISTAVRIMRLAAAATVGAAAIEFVREGEWLDTLNSGLWIAVVILLEVEVRYPRTVTLRRMWFTTTALALYSGLILLVPVWAWRGSWLNAWDALLWLIAFAMIEMDVLAISRTRPVIR